MPTLLFNFVKRRRFLPIVVLVCAICQGISSETCCAQSTQTTENQRIDQVEYRAFQFFWNKSDPVTGLTKDRAGNFGADRNNAASIAATGYALTAESIAVERGWISRPRGFARVLRTLLFVRDQLPNDHGFYYHFVDPCSGQRIWNCELSSIDTALLLCGVLTAGQYFQGTEIQTVAQQIYDRTDFAWLQKCGGERPDGAFLPMDWTPERGWSRAQWADFSECPLLYFEAMGSSTHPISPEAWNELHFNPSQVEGYDVLRGAGPIFIWQMGAGYFDYRGKRESHGYDFWVNSVNAHLANHAYCVRNSANFKTYSDTVWGLTASDEPPPVNYGAEEDHDGRNDGTVAPSAAITSILFVPQIGKAALNTLFDQYQDKLWGQYGFSNAFNVNKNWYDRDVVGIDLGMTLVALEDYRSGLIWHLTDGIPAIQKGMAAAGFHRTTEPGDRPLIKTDSRTASSL